MFLDTCGYLQPCCILDGRCGPLGGLLAGGRRVLARTGLCIWTAVIGALRFLGNCHPGQQDG